ncbi:MAG: PIN domain-containing protein [Deltaproteobacteria bacterium]|nr:PIN domain-containing protein [Deltaproteobacteria bacterium]
MGIKTKAYVDTSALISFLDQSDTYYPLFVQLFADPPPLVTSSLVIAEGHGWFLKRYDSNRALQFLGFVSTLKALQILPIGSREIKEAEAVLRKFSDQEISLADACGLNIMKQNRLKSCWSTDRHLALTGVPLIIHEN